MTQPDGLGGFWSTLKSAATGVIPGMVAGAAVGAAVSGPFAPIGAAVGAAAGAFAGSSKGIKSQMDADRTAGEFTGQGSGEVDNTGALVVGVSAGDGAFRLPCGSGPGAQVKNCCPPNWQTKSVRVNPDGSTGVTCSNGDLVTVKGTEVPLRPGNGWTAWNTSWAEFARGSALPVPPGLKPAPSTSPPHPGAVAGGSSPAPSASGG